MNPAELFLAYWSDVRYMSSSALTRAMRPEGDFDERINCALALDDFEACVIQIQTMVSQQPQCFERGTKLQVMGLIDEFFLRVHPRTPLISASNGSRPPIPLWLENLQLERECEGNYAILGENSLIPRGPLARLPRDEYASSGESLPDRFSALAVVKRQIEIDQTPIRITLTVKGPGAAEGVVPGNRAGAEKVTFVPVAQKSQHLNTIERIEHDRHYFDYSVSDARNVPECLSYVLGKIGFSDIVMAPELMIKESLVEDIINRTLEHSNAFRIFVLGSGSTEENDGVQTWNQSTVINGSGAIILRQRKIWQAGLDETKAKLHGLNTINGRLVMEDNCSGEEVNVVDIDGFGRCMVLICQDLEARPLSDDLIRLYQPDWIFSPILDTGVEIGRWMHQRAYNLSALSQSRFLISSSTALAHRQNKPNVACGMAIGPKDKTAHDKSRVCEIAVCEEGCDPGFASLTWREDWGQTDIGVK